jgi:hypothetical protein
MFIGFWVITVLVSFFRVLMWAIDMFKSRRCLICKKHVVSGAHTCHHCGAPYNRRMKKSEAEEAVRREKAYKAEFEKALTNQPEPGTPERKAPHEARLLSDPVYKAKFEKLLAPAPGRVGEGVLAEQPEPGTSEFKARHEARLLSDPVYKAE